MIIIVARSELVYEVESLNRTGTDTVHALRMLHYPEASTKDDFTEELKEYASFA